MINEKRLNRGENPDPKTPPPPPPGESNSRGTEPIGVEIPKVIHELEFPQKILFAMVIVYSGSTEIGTFSTLDYNIELLAPNVVKISSDSSVRVIYNATIVVERVKLL